MIAAILVLQVALLATSLIFPWRARQVIVPRRAWWSFALRDLMWLPVVVIEYLIVTGCLAPRSLEAVMWVQLGIIGVFFYATVNRYHLQWREADYRRRLAQRIDACNGSEAGRPQPRDEQQ